jgi:hypothetical protein
MQPDPMNTMHLCSGHCDRVPDEVCDAVFASVKSVKERSGDERDARAAHLAQRMAVEGWRFCRCFPMLRTQRHEMIFSLVHTNLANLLAHKAALASAA